MGKIIFLCTPGRPPVEAEQALRSFGIKVSRRSAEIAPDNIVEAAIHVPDRQLRWAASLIAGEGFPVIEPRNVKGTKPRTRWGVERRSYGPQSIVIYVLEAIFGHQHHRPAPVRREK